MGQVIVVVEFVSVSTHVRVVDTTHEKGEKHTHSTDKSFGRATKHMGDRKSRKRVWEDGTDR